MSASILAKAIRWAAAMLLAFAVHGFAADSVLEKSEAIIGKQLPNFQLLNQEGKYVALHSYRGNYLLVSFIYTSCPGPCVAISQSVGNLLSALDPDLAKNVYAFSVTFDPENDSPEKMKAYGKEFTDSFDRWLFVKGDHQVTGAIAEGLGFFYEKKAPGWYEHMNRLTLVGPDMRPIVNFYGTDFEPAKVEKAIRDSMAGRSVTSALTDRLSQALILCSDFDFRTKTYKVNYLFVLSLLGQIILIIGTVTYLLWDEITGIFRKIFKGRPQSAN